MKFWRLALGTTVLLGSMVASIWCAGALLLYRLFGIAAINGATPLTWLQYFVHFGNDDVTGQALKQSGILALIGFTLTSVLTVYVLVRGGNAKQKQHGDARFANDREIKKSGLLSQDGIIVGRHGKETLRFPGSEFVMLSAPTRGGKGVSVVIPNALSWDESLVVMDVKGENQEITSKYRESMGHEVYCFNPFDQHGKTHRWNPLDYVRRDPRYSYGDLTKLAEIIYPEEGEHGFFQRTAQNLFIGLGLLLIEVSEMPVSIGHMLKVSSGKGGLPVQDYLVDIMEMQQSKNRPLSEPCSEALMRFVANDEKTLANILQTFSSPLTLFGDVMIDAATSHSDFNFLDLRRKKMTIYVGIPINRMGASRVMINLFWSQLVSTNTDHLPSKYPEYKYKVAMLMDEFVMMGQMSVISKGAAFIAGYGLRLISIVQSPSQLYAKPPEGYGEHAARAYISNHSCKMIFTPDELSDAESLSKMLGNYTYKARSVTVGKQGKLNYSIEKGGTVSEQSRPLMLPQELREMPFDDQIVMLKGHKPIKCSKIKYYSDATYMNMLKSVSPSLSQIKGLPTEEQFMSAWASGELNVDVPALDLHRIAAKKYGTTKNVSLDSIENLSAEDITVVVDDITDGLKAECSQENVNESVGKLLDRVQEENGLYVEEKDHRSDGHLLEKLFQTGGRSDAVSADAKILSKDQSNLSQSSVLDKAHL